LPYLNTEQVYDWKTEGDPTFSDSVDLSSRLKHGHNSFVILSVNWGGPAHYIGQLTLDGKVLLSMTFGLASTPNGVVALGRRNNFMLTAKFQRRFTTAGRCSW